MYGDFVDCRLKDVLDRQGGLGHVSVDMWEAQPEYPGSRALIAYWEAQRAADGLVHRDAIRPKDVLKLLPNLFILEPRAGDWVIRLVGTGIVERTGHEMTNLKLSEIYEPKTAALLAGLYDRAVRTGQPVAIKGRMLGFGIEHALAESVALPVAAREGAATHILGAIFFHDQSGA